MGKLLAFDRGRFLHYSVPRSRFQTVIEETFLVLGVLGAVVVPAIVSGVLGGPVPPSVYIAIAEAGVILGLARFIWLSAEVAPAADTQTAPITQDGATNRRKAS